MPSRVHDRIRAMAQIARRHYAGFPSRKRYSTSQNFNLIYGRFCWRFIARASLPQARSFEISGASVNPSRTLEEDSTAQSVGLSSAGGAIDLTTQDSKADIQWTDDFSCLP
jgi:hypothetical protein